MSIENIEGEPFHPPTTFRDAMTADPAARSLIRPIGQPVLAVNREATPEPPKVDTKHPALQFLAGFVGNKRRPEQPPGTGHDTAS